MKVSPSPFTCWSPYRTLCETARRHRLSLALAVALLGASSLVCCGGTAGNASGSTSGGGSDQPQLSATPTSLSLGNVALTSSSTQTVTLTNVGNSSVNVSQISVSGAGFSTSGPTLPLTLAPGQSTSASVVFAPTGYGTFTGSVSVVSSATNSPLIVSLNGSSYADILSWDPSTSGVVGYNVYRGTQSGGPYGTKMNSSLITSTTFTDTSVQAGQTLFYVVTAVDSSSVESNYSNQISATVPSP
ncbi:MAG TPA: choice-of-anchor D domain-containing protein [Candidatus Acidoferrales bacterium]|nr:choice-of-anchor D domain-containing protein [Candidatus Acidoferrales bacterium]